MTAFLLGRKWKTEYHSNFKAPSLFRYEEGVWKGANPPHIQPQEDSSESGKINGKLKHSKSEGDIPSWFAEVRHQIWFPQKVVIYSHLMRALLLHCHNAIQI